MKYFNQLYSFVKSLANGNAACALLLFNRISLMTRNDTHLEEQNNTLENKMINNINYFISTYLTNKTNASRDLKYVLAYISIS